VVEFGFERRSGRVISIARAMLASLFVLSVWVDPTQPAFGAGAAYVLLGGYALISIALAVVTWKEWWLDAKLAGLAHLLDVAVFAALVVLTAGYTSPFFVFFSFLLLSAAIRWGWRETALTAAALILLYVSTGAAVVLTDPGNFELQRFIIRAGHLVILSALLIWFGMHQSNAFSGIRLDRAAPASIDQSPLAAGLTSAANAVGASSALLFWRDSKSGQEQLLTFGVGDGTLPANVRTPIRGANGRKPYLYDIGSNRAVIDVPGRMPSFHRADELLDVDAAMAIGLRRGLAVPLRLETGSGEVFLQGVRSLSADHLRFAEELSRDIVGQIQRHELLQAVEERGEARARLSFARDLHDSVVQFLAGTAFRIEAILRKGRTGGAIETDLEELKSLMLKEQGELRTYMVALRGGHEIKSAAAADELRALCQRLSQQWDIDCAIDVDLPPGPIPVRVYLDAQQLVREAVANAVRHGKAAKVRIGISSADEAIQLQIVDDGRGFPTESSAAGLQPRSLRERVSQAGGDVALASGSGGTSVTVTLPLKGQPQ
jgi:signal transduction histidine kinase